MKKPVHRPLSVIIIGVTCLFLFSCGTSDNTQNQVSQIEGSNGDNAKLISELGQPSITTIDEDNDGIQDFEIRVDVDYQELKLSIIEMDLIRNLKIREDVEVYNKDFSIKSQRTFTYNLNGLKDYYIKEFFYDDLSRLIKTVSLSSTPEGDESKYHVEHIFNGLEIFGNEKPSKSISYTNDNLVSETFRSFDSATLTETETSEYSTGEYRTKTTTYDKSGNIIEYTIGIDPYPYTVKFGYDEKGRLSFKSSDHDYDGTFTITDKFGHDENDNMNSHLSDKDDDGFFETREYTNYSSFGEPIEQSIIYLSPDNEIISHKKTLFEYDSRNRITCVRYDYDNDNIIDAISYTEWPK